MIDRIASRLVRMPRDLGSAPGDAVSADDSASLRHVARAIVDGPIPTAADLVAARHASPALPPDPFDWFEAEHRAHLEAPAPGDDACTIRVLTWNLALLDRPYLWTRARMPEVPRRRAVLFEHLLRGDWDALLLQEVWDDADLDRLDQLAGASGYRVYGGSARHHSQHGLAIVVRDATFPDGPDERTEAQYATQYPLEQWPGPDVKRGFLGWRVRHHSGLGVHFVTTHATPFLPYWRHRRLQARELGSFVGRLPPSDLIVCGGDANAGPYYPDDVWLTGRGEAFEGLWNDAVSYALLRHYGGLHDAAVLGGLAHRRDHRAHTASDRNGLYARSYAGEEPEARMDLMLVRPPRGLPWRVTRARLAFVEPVAFGGAGSFELSDHYGLDCTVRVGGRAE